MNSVGNAWRHTAKFERKVLKGGKVTMSIVSLLYSRDSSCSTWLCGSRRLTLRSVTGKQVDNCFQSSLNLRVY